MKANELAMPKRHIDIDSINKNQQRERKALVIGYLDQINKLKIELSIRISSYDIYPTQSQVDYLAGVNTFLAEMLEDVRKQTY